MNLGSICAMNVLAKASSSPLRLRSCSVIWTSWGPVMPRPFTRREGFYEMGAVRLVKRDSRAANATA